MPRRKPYRRRTQRLYRRLAQRLQQQYAQMWQALREDNLRLHLWRSQALTRTLARISRIETLTGITFPYDWMQHMRRGWR